MPRVRAAYSLYQRAMKKRKVWYFQTYDENGNRLPGRSTGQILKSKAREYCDSLLKSGNLLTGKVATLEDWVAERNWYVWDDEDPACLYCRSRLARSSKDKPGIGRSYVNFSRRSMEIHVLPVFGKKRLDKITPNMLETWMFDLVSGGLAPKTANNTAGAFRTIMKEAVRLGIVQSDPWEKVPLFNPGDPIRGSLDTAEALQLMNPRAVSSIWEGHQLYYLVNLTAMLTACRQGELLALQKNDVFRDHLDVTKSWQKKYHVSGTTKTKTKAPVAIPPYLYTAITEFCLWDGFVFSLNAGKAPATGARITEALYRAMEKIGISEETRKRRGIVFHSWRRFCNSYLRARGITDAKIQAQTHHSTQKMTEHYQDWHPEDFADVATQQQYLIEALSDEKKRNILAGNKRESK